MEITEGLINWYKKHKRDLPWRHTKDPYKVWLSEIILQQTRVEQGIPYYHAFTSAFPKINNLANASNEEVMRLWQGLGYYSRARNLHFTAKKIVNDFNGNFPVTYEGLLELKGVGEYTASAIASFCYALSTPVVDGNVLRALSRLFGISTPIDSLKGKNEICCIARELLDTKNPGIYNQAMMEFGALVCKPLSPDCEHCFLNDKCEAFAKKIVATLPVKSGKTKVQTRYFNYFFIHSKNHVYLKKRMDKDIWENLYEFPLVETDQRVSLNDLEKTSLWKLIIGDKPIKISVSEEYKHVLSHRIIYATFYQVEHKKELKKIKEYQKIELSDLNNYGLPRVITRYLESL